MGSVIDFFVDDIPKDAVTVKYNRNSERISLRSIRNLKDVNELTKYFKERRLFVEQEDARDSKNAVLKNKDRAVCLFVSDKEYELFIDELETLCAERLREMVDGQGTWSTGDPELEDSLDAIIELLELRRFFTRYFSVREKKKYCLRCYYALV